MGFFSRIFLRYSSQSRTREVLCANAKGLHRMRYQEWGAADNPRTLVCVHGLTRNGRDFDALGAALATRYRVICPDIVGRGHSDWLVDSSGYAFPQYVSDMMVLLGRLNVNEVHWLGTSMGGLIGMIIASQQHSPITRLVLNDVGPIVTPESLRRIGEYVGKAPRFADCNEAERYIRKVSAPFGVLSDAQWRQLTESSIRQSEDGTWSMTYDPALGESFNMAYLMHRPVDLWPIYDAIRCPTLVTRGASSDLLTAEVHAEMAKRGPRAQLAEIPDVGHAPMFLDEGQIAVVRNFLLAG